jgi:adenylosuccinate synthase
VLGAQWGDEGKGTWAATPRLERPRLFPLATSTGNDRSDFFIGKIVDVLCEGVQLCARYVYTITATFVSARTNPRFVRAQGGHNAGHTIVKDGTTFDVHILRESTLLLLRQSLLRLVQPPAFSLKDV